MSVRSTGMDELAPVSHWKHKDCVGVAHHTGDGDLPIRVIRFPVPGNCRKSCLPPTLQVVIIDLVTGIVVEVMQPGLYARIVCAPMRCQLGTGGSNCACQ